MKKTVRKRSTVPVWGFCAVWLVWCLLLPLQRTWHLLLLLALSCATARVLSKKFPGETVTEDLPPDTGDAALDAAIAAGQESVRKMRALNDAIPGAGMSRRIDEMEKLTGKIFAEVERSPSKLPQIRRFMNYYLPTVLSLLERYVHLQEAGSGANVREAMRKTEELIDRSVDAFRRQLDALFAGEALDITAEITVMNQMMHAEGMDGRRDFAGQG